MDIVDKALVCVVTLLSLALLYRVAQERKTGGTIFQRLSAPMLKFVWTTVIIVFVGKVGLALGRPAWSIPVLLLTLPLIWYARKMRRQGEQILQEMQRGSQH